ncbi:MAG: hypothetical protein QM504_06890 [Pseudomonadota bacterium]
MDVINFIENNYSMIILLVFAAATFPKFIEVCNTAIEILKKTKKG